MSAEVVYKWLQTGGARQQAVPAMLRSLIEYLQKSGENMNLAFVTGWQTSRKDDE